MKTLVIVTKPLGELPERLTRVTLEMASMVALVQEGVYNKPFDGEQTYGMPGGHRAVQEPEAVNSAWPENWKALKDDVEARRVKTDCELVSYDDLVTAIENHDRIITL